MSLPISTEAAINLWNVWNIRFLIILSFAVQNFLTLMAPMRKGRLGKSKFIRRSIWLAYVSADWIATYATGQIVKISFSTTTTATSKQDDNPSSNDILVFWAPFLLLHLGGPDTITSYAIEDNNFWVRHLLGLVLQVCFTIFVIVMSANNTLLLPTVLVLFAGVIKYVERNVAFYLACFEHFGSNWKEKSDDIGLPVPTNFKDDSIAAGKLFGILKTILSGPLIEKDALDNINAEISRMDKGEVLRVMEIELSLLYEALHTKLPVIASRGGMCVRIAYQLCCILAGILFCFFQEKGQVKSSSEFDTWLTVGLLVGAVELDLMSLILLIIYSDWFRIVFKFTDQPDDERRHRWSNTIPQSNIITYHHDVSPIWWKKLTGFPYICAFSEAIENCFRCESSQNFSHQVWRHIFDEVREIQDTDDGSKISRDWVLRRDENGPLLSNDPLLMLLGGLDYPQSLLLWHVVTEFSLRDDGCLNSYRETCKQLSDYMFHLLVTESPLLSPVLDNSKQEIKRVLEEINSSSDDGGVYEAILKRRTTLEADTQAPFSLLDKAVLVTRLLKDEANYEWIGMSQIWVQHMCHAAINGKPDVHAEQVSQGGELLTLVRLLMNHLGLGRYYTKLPNLARLTF